MRFNSKLLAQARVIVTDLNQQSQPKLIYKGQLANRILYLKSFSVMTSLGLAGSYKYVLAKKGFTATMASIGFAFLPFFLSPIAIAFVFRRYVTQLYYDDATDTYTAIHYGYLLRKQRLDFKREDVNPTAVTSMLNTFTVGKQPLFVHDEDLIDAESVEIYRRMLGLDKVKVDPDDSSNKSDNPSG